MAKLAAALVGSSQGLIGEANFTGSGEEGDRFQELLLPHASEFSSEWIVSYDEELAGSSRSQMITEDHPDDRVPEGFGRKERHVRKIGSIPVRYDNQKQELHRQIDGIGRLQEILSMRSVPKLSD